jgi:GNAT superfamily N-acetyltransferase
VTVRPVLSHEWLRLREIRLRSLQTDPAAFGSTHERDLAHPDEWWTAGAVDSEEGREKRYFAIDDGARWLGLALVRADDESLGDAVINAMWVAPEIRGRGHSKRLCEACIAWATERGFPRINVSAKLDNDIAVCAYRAAGFEPIRNQDDELVLTRYL